MIKSASSTVCFSGSAYPALSTVSPASSMFLASVPGQSLYSLYCRLLLIC